MAIDRTWLPTDDSGSGTDGTVFNRAFYVQICDAIDAIFTAAVEFGDDVTVAGTLTPSGGMSTGSAATPGIPFAGDLDTGIFQDGANGLGLATAGIKALGIDSTQFIDSPTQPRCSAWANAVSQSVANSTDTAVQFNAENFDVGGLHDTVTNNTRFTVPVGGDGLYLLSGIVAFASSATGDRRAYWTKNGSSSGIAAESIVQAGGTAVAAQVQNTTLVVLAAGDYVELHAWQNSGSALTISASSVQGVTSGAFVVKLW